MEKYNVLYLAFIFFCFITPLYAQQQDHFERWQIPLTVEEVLDKYQQYSEVVNRRIQREQFAYSSSAIPARGILFRPDEDILWQNYTAQKNQLSLTEQKILKERLEQYTYEQQIRRYNGYCCNSFVREVASYLGVLFSYFR